MSYHIVIVFSPVDACVVAARAAERLGADVIAQVVLEMMFELCDEWTSRTRQDAVTPDVDATVHPKLLLYTITHNVQRRHAAADAIQRK